MLGSVLLYKASSTWMVFVLLKPMESLPPKPGSSRKAGYHILVHQRLSEPNLSHFFGLYSKQTLRSKKFNPIQSQTANHLKALTDCCDLGFLQGSPCVPGKGSPEV